MLKVRAKDIMTEEMVTLKETATVAQAAHILLRFRINGVLIVNKNDKTKLVGLVTTTDLLRVLDKCLTKGRNRIEMLETFSKLPVKRIASKVIMGVKTDTKLEKLIALMNKENKHTIPIFDGGKLVGIIGKHDILNAAFGE